MRANQVYLWTYALCRLIAAAGPPGTVAACDEATPLDAGEKAAVCELVPIRTGICKLGKDHLYGKRFSANDRVDFAIYAFLVRGGGNQHALIDLGPKSTAYCNRMFRRHGFFRDLGPSVPSAQRYPDDIVQPEGNVFAALRRRRIPPAAIGHIVFTHFHADHHGMHDAKDGGAAEDFPNAVIHASARGWQNNLDKRRDGEWKSYVDYAFGDFLLRRAKAGKVRFADDTEVIPGVRTCYLGGHSVCSQAVLVNTKSGMAIIASDEVYTYKLLEMGVLPQIRTTPKRYRAAIARLIDIAERNEGVLIPLHDPIVWKAYQTAGEKWLDALRPHSTRAITAYQSRSSRDADNR